MDLGAMWMRMKAHRWTYTLSILATLSLGILIGTLISSEVKGKEGQKNGEATPLSLPAAQPTNNPLSHAFAQIAKQLFNRQSVLWTDRYKRKPWRAAIVSV